MEMQTNNYNNIDKYSNKTLTISNIQYFEKELSGRLLL